MASDIGVDQASRFVEGGDVRLGTAFHLPNTPIWTQDPTKDLDKDGLNDEWENIAVQSLKPTFLFPAGEGLFENPDHRVALFTRVTPIELIDKNENPTTYIVFLNTAAYTKDYGAPDLGNLTGGHNGDVSNFQTVWKVLDTTLDNSPIVLERLFTSGHLKKGLGRPHGRFEAIPGGENDIKLTEDGFLKIYMEEDKHSNWSSQELHDKKEGIYPIGSDVEIRPDTYNVGEPWFHPAPFTNDVNSLFAGESVWNDSDGRFCGGLECDNATRGKVLGPLLGSIIGGMIGGIFGVGGIGAIAGGVVGGIYGKDIDGASGQDIGNNLTDQMIDGLFKGQNVSVTRKGIDFYASGVPLPDFNLVINQLQTLDEDGLDGGTINNRADFYAKVTIDGKQYTTDQIKERDKDKGIGVFPEWGFYYTGDRRVVRVTIEILDDDKVGSGGKDDRADINGLQGEKDLHFLYDRVKGELTLTDKDFEPVEGQSPLTGVNGQFYFEGNLKPNGDPGDDQVGIWFTLPVPAIASQASDGTLQLNVGPNNILGSNPDEVVSIRHMSGEGGSEVIEINSQSFTQTHGIGTPKGAFTHISGLAGEGNDTIILDSVLTSVYLGGGSGDDRLEIVNSPIGITQRSVLDGGDGNDTLGGGSGNDDIYGGNNDDQIFGGAGDDHITGDDGNDYIDAGSGNDIVSGGIGFDVILGGVGEDIVGGGGNADYIDGGDGDDVILGDSSFDIINKITIAIQDTEAGDTILGGSGNDVILGEWGDDLIYGNDGIDKLLGGVGNDTIDGGNDNDTLEGNNGDDVLYGGSGNDSLDGGTGDDWLVGGAGIDRLDGGDGIDTADLSDIEIGVIANLAAGTFSYPNELGVAITEVIRNIENLIGTQFNDNLIGNQAANRLEGGAGNDTLSGGDGSDTLFGGAGDDLLSGGNGIDFVDGGDGFDRLRLEEIQFGVKADLNAGTMIYRDAIGNLVTETFRNIEGIIGGQFDDELIGHVINGSTLDSRGGNDILRGGAGNDDLNGGDGNDTLLGGAGNDLLAGGNGIDFIDGGDGFDYLRLEEFQTGVKVDLNTDTMTYQNATGNIVTETFRNIEGIIGGWSDDELTGHATNNSVLDARGGNDTIRGGAGNDNLSGGDGDDILFGGAGDDWLAGGAGVDFIDGGAGFDIVLLGDLKSGVTVDLNTDRMTYRDALGNIVSEIILNIEGVTSGEFDDELIGNEGINRLDGRGGNDILRGGAGDDYFLGGDGTDFIDGGAGFDTVNLIEDFAFGVVANLNTGTLSYTDVVGRNITETILNIEAVIATQFNDEVIGNESNNLLYGFGGNDRLNGGAGSDRLFGGAGNDELIGGDGDDILAGGSGSLNRLFGNAGSDIFVLASDGLSQVLDFELGKDRIGLSENLTVSQLRIEQGTDINSSSTWIKLAVDNSNLMLLSNVQASALTTAMFLPVSSYQPSLLA